MLRGNASSSLGVNYPTGNAVTGRPYLDEVAAAGNRGTELGPLGYLPKDPDTDRDELARRGLTLIGATRGHIVGNRSAVPELTATLHQLAALLRSLSARHLVIMDESAWYPPGGEGVLDAAGWRELVATVREAPEPIEGEFGLKATCHPHIGTAVEFGAQADRLLAETDIRLLADFARLAMGRVRRTHSAGIERLQVLEGSKQ